MPFKCATSCATAPLPVNISKIPRLSIKFYRPLDNSRTVIIYQTEPEIVRTMKSLNEREKEILKSMIQIYSDRGEPVGSEVVSKTIGGVSSATVRNIFAAMEERGFIKKSHCSSGRLPTDYGLRYFVDNILKVKGISANEKRMLDNYRQNKEDSTELIDSIPQMLSEVSSYTGIIMTRSTAETSLRHIDFVSIGQKKVLVILVDNIGGITNRIIEIDDDISQNDLEKLRNFINSNLSDKSLFEIKSHFLCELTELQKKYDVIFGKIIDLTKGKLKANMSGETNAFDYLCISDVKEMKHILESFRRNQFYLNLFNKVADSSDMRIFIGTESDVFNSADCSTILTKYEIDEGKIVGVLGVIGPKRMNYGKIIPIVDYTKNLLISLYEK